MSTSAISSASLTATPLQGDSDKKDQAARGDGSFLGTLIDIVNPLQHIPIVSTIYREATGDAMSGFANVVGGGLFGGPLGLAASVVNEMVTAETGTDIGGNVLQQAEALAAPADPYAAAPAMTPLAPDQGEAALLIALTGTEQTSATAPETVAAPLSAEAAEAMHSLERYRDPTLGLKDAPKQEQLRMKLEKIAIDMKA
jgi:hypothetical protein